MVMRSLLSIVALHIVAVRRAAALHATARMRFNNQFLRQSRRCYWHSIRRSSHDRSMFHASTFRMMPEGPEVRNLADQFQHGVGKRLIDIQFLSGRYVRHDKPVGFYGFAKTMTKAVSAPANSNTAGGSVRHKDGDHVGGEDPAENNPLLPTIDTVVKWSCKGKFMYIILDDGGRSRTEPSHDEDDFQRSIWITLGMTGWFVGEAKHHEDPTHGRWYLDLVDTETGNKLRTYYHDRRNFGTLKFSLSKKELDDKLSSLGYDLMDASTSEDLFLTTMANQNQDMNICKFLMNQSKIAGVGNYILAEGLHRSLIDPFASLDELHERQRRTLFNELRLVMMQSYAKQQRRWLKDSIKTPGTKSGNGEADADANSSGLAEFELQCYNRARCPQGEEVIRDTAGPHGRTIWYTKKQLFKPLDERFVSLSHHQAQTEHRNGSDDAEAARSQNANDWKHVDLVQQLSDEGWKGALQHILESERFQNLQAFLQDEAASGATIFPPPQQVFASLNQCRFDDVKIVIVGQDPYHGAGQGHGLAFSVQKDVPPPPSLKNIIQELKDDVGIKQPVHGNLESWSRQGVLLLNSVLTVRQGEANSHAKKGWEEVTDAIIEALNQREDGLVFLLWGNPAQKKASGVNTEKHVVIKTSHPSPLGARRTASPFLGSRCFSDANRSLALVDKAAVDWNIV